MEAGGLYSHTLAVIETRRAYSCQMRLPIVMRWLWGVVSNECEERCSVNDKETASRNRTAERKESRSSKRAQLGLGRQRREGNQKQPSDGSQS